MQHAERRLHHAPEGEARRRAGGDEHRFRLAHRIGALDLGQEHAIDRHLGRGDEVGVAPGARQRIDAQQRLALAIATLAQRGGDGVARARLGVGRDGILEIEDQRIGRQRARLLQRARVGAGHIEHRAARAGGGGHRHHPRGGS